MIDPISIITLITTCVMLGIQVIQMISTGTFKSSCCGVKMEHNEGNKNQPININISIDESSSD